MVCTHTVDQLINNVNKFYSIESSHSIKAHRRKLRQQQGDMYGYKGQNTTEYQMPLYNGYNETARWIQEQRDRQLYRPLDYVNQPKPSQSLSSLIPVKDENPSSRLLPIHRDSSNGSFDSRFGLTATPTGSDISDSTTSQHGLLYQGNFDSRFNALGTASKLHDPLSLVKSNQSSSYYSSHRSSVDSQYANGDIPASLSVQPSESSDPNGFTSLLSFNDVREVEYGSWLPYSK